MEKTTKFKIDEKFEDLQIAFEEMAQKGELSNFGELFNDIQDLRDKYLVKS